MAAKKTRKLNLALQGGGSHGAFTWGVLDRLLQQAPDWLESGGLLAVISFHSLEDRRVKTAFVSDDRLQRVTRKPLIASDAEAETNPRSRSAKLRVAQRR
jgi:16S rRNA (cytosine1402-N4)-methyltransferase